ncbi:hypothetical protein VTN96DRAFT_2788 [Rasamsonia emersonii]
MATTSTPSNADAFLSAVEARRSLYKLTNKSPISDDRIHEIVATAIKHVPSTFNVQSARAVILLREQHEKLWDIGERVLREEMPPAVYASLAPKVAGLRAAYGTVLWFEDEASLDALKQKNPAIQSLVREWSDHSSGMHQFVVWTALEREGLGCNLQHYNFSETFRKDVLETWNLPQTWNLRAQLVFGQPSATSADGGLPEREKEKSFKPIEGERLLRFG